MTRGALLPFLTATVLIVGGVCKMATHKIVEGISTGISTEETERIWCEARPAPLTLVECNVRNVSSLSNRRGSHFGVAADK